MTKLILASFVVFLVSFWLRNDLSHLSTPQASLREEPLQTPSSTLPFTVKAGDRHYRVEPVFDYEIYGLVVSFRHHDGNYGVHRRWGDHINIADVCVVWSSNAFDIDLTQFEFWNGQFSCSFETSDQEAWSEFSVSQISNNHLITENNALGKEISDLRIGDQIHIKGMLAQYSSDNGSSRGTSITRTDTGDRACETIYVTDYNVLQRYYSPWRILMYISLITLALSLALYLITPHSVRE